MGTSGPNGYLTEAVVAKANNNLVHGKVSLFPFGNGSSAFKVFLVLKDSANRTIFPDGGLFLDCKLRGDSVPAPYFLFNQNSTDRNRWSNRNITLIPLTDHNQVLLNEYDIYWVSGQDSPA